MYYESIDGLRIYYKKISGGGRPIIFLHGLAGSSDSFKAQSRVLRGRAQLLIDFRGHGRSSKPSGDYYSISKLLSDVNGVLRVEGVSDFDVVGFSMGAYVATLLDAKKRVLINPVLSGDSIKKSFILKALVARLMPSWFLRLFIKGGSLSDYHGLLSDYAKMLVSTPSYVYWVIIKQLLNLGVSDLSDSVIITSSGDEVINHLRSDYLVSGRHHVLVQNPRAVSDLLKNLMN